MEYAKIIVNVAPEFKDRLFEQAKDRCISVSALVRHLLENKLTEWEQSKRESIMKSRREHLSEGEKITDRKPGADGIQTAN